MFKMCLHVKTVYNEITFRNGGLPVLPEVDDVILNRTPFILLCF